MEAELAALAASAAAALVQRMVEDGWEQVRGRLARLFARRGGAPEADGGDESVRRVEEELDAAREELIGARDAGDEQIESDVQSEWRSRLRRRLAVDPELASELRALLSELTSDQPRDRGGNVTNTITGGVHYGTVIQAGRVGDVTLGHPPRDARRPRDPR